MSTLFTASLMVGLLAMGAPVAAKKTTIQFMAWVTNKLDTDGYEKVIRMFQAEHPDIVVKLVGVASGGGDDYLSKYLAMATANVAPDVVAIPLINFPKMVESRLFDDLSSWLAKDKMKLSEWSRAAQEACNWNGKAYGLPSAGSSDYWGTYNRKLYLEAGLPDPEDVFAKGNWTIENAIAMSQKLVRTTASGKVDRVGILQSPEDVGVSIWIRAYGGSLMSPDGKRCTLNSKEAAAGLNALQDAVWGKNAISFASAPPHNIGLDTGAKSEKYGMTWWWGSVVSYIRSQKVNWPINCIPMPRGPASNEVSPTWIHTITLSRQGKHKAAAWEFMKYLSGPVGSEVLAKDLQWMSTRRDVFAKYQQLMVGQGLTGYRFLEDAMDKQFLWPRSNRAQAFRDKFGVQLTRIWSKKVSIPQGLALAEKEINEVLARK